MWLIVKIGWRTSTLLLAGAALVVLVPVLLLMRDDPADLGLQPYGGAAPVVNPARMVVAERAEPRRAHAGRGLLERAVHQQQRGIGAPHRVRQPPDR